MGNFEMNNGVAESTFASWDYFVGDLADFLDERPTVVREALEASEAGAASDRFKRTEIRPERLDGRLFLTEGSAAKWLGLDEAGIWALRFAADESNALCEADFAGRRDKRVPAAAERVAAMEAARDRWRNRG